METTINAATIKDLVIREEKMNKFNEVYADFDQALLQMMLNQDCFKQKEPSNNHARENWLRKSQLESRFKDIIEVKKPEEQKKPVEKKPEVKKPVQQKPEAKKPVEQKKPVG